MQRKRDDIDELFRMADPIATDFMVAGRMPMPSLFGGKDPFDDPFFTRPLGGMFEHGPLFQSRSSTATAHAARASGSKGLVIEELASDDEMEEDVQEKRAGVVHGKVDHSRKQQPSVQHPDDDDETNEGNVLAVNRGIEHTRTQGNGARSRGFSYSKVTYGGVNGAYYSSTRSRRVGGDGVMIEESREADKTTGQATHRVSRGINDKGHSVTRKLNPDGKVDTLQTLHNLDEEGLAGFEDAWRKGNFSGHLPGFINPSGMTESSAGSREPRELVNWGDMANPAAIFGAGGRGQNRSGSNTSSNARAKKIVRINIE
ncbi:unnamed protein product [Linum tenue]|uniref:Uncharacterized protein n=1 Tax=Linum tenue TaxID=586396 RepID=A0AAV0ITE5_9ROSI|nr:unnamed protein product [Linum tenue]